MKRVLVTGVPGWLSNRLLRDLNLGNSDYPELKPQNKYWISTLTHPNNRRAPLFSYWGVTDDVVECNLTKTNVYDLTKIMIRGKIDEVVHVAGVIHPKWTKEFWDVNVEGTEKLVMAAEDARVKRFIYISSNSAFGDNPFIMTEDSEPHPYREYGESKAVAEAIVMASNIPWVIIRPCWFFGEGQPKRQTSLMKQIRSGHPLMPACGMNLKTLSYVGDVSAAIIKVLESDVVNEDFWIGSERPYSQNEIFEAIALLLEVTLKPIRLPHMVNTVARAIDWLIQKCGYYWFGAHVVGEGDRQIAVSVDKAKRILGWTPRVDLYEGMRRSVEWCKQQGQL